MIKQIKLVVIILTLGAGLAYDQVRYGSEFRIGFEQDCSDGPVFMEPLADSGYAVLWKRQRPHTSIHDLMVQTRRDNDTTATNPVAVCTGAENSFLQPNLLTLEGGGFAVAWSESASPLAGSYLNVRFYSRDGQETGYPVRLYHPYTPDRLWILGVQGQTIEISWYVHEMGINAVVGHLARPDIGPSLSEYTIYDFRQIGYVAPEQARLGNDNRVICWRVNESELGEQAAVLLSAQGSEIRRWTLPPSWYNFELNLQVISLASGNFVIVGSSNQYSNFAQFYSPDGTEIGILMQPLTSPLTKEPLLKTYGVSMGEMGCLIYGGRSSYSDVGIIGQYFNNDGKKIHDQFTFHDSKKRVATQACSGHNSDLLIAKYAGGSCGTIVLAERMPSPLRPVPPAEFQCLAPANDTFLKTDKVTLSWQSAAPSLALYPWETLSYSIAISEAPDSGFVRIAENKTDTSYTLTNLKGGRSYFWKVLAKNSYGGSLWSSNINAFFVSYSVNVAKSEYSRPQAVRLLQNYPNPFNPSTTIEFSIAAPNHISLKVYSLLGEQVANLVDERMPAGMHKAVWNAGELSNGIYYYVFEAGNYREVRKAILIK